MANIDNIRELKYKASSGAEFSLLFEAVERIGGKKISIHDLALQDKASVQDLGNQAERYPISCFIAGAENDTKADAFYNALHERGPGTLFHPRYGDIQVQVVSVSQAENIVNGNRRVDFSIEFVRYYSDVGFPKTVTLTNEKVVSESIRLTNETVADCLGEWRPGIASEVSEIKEQLEKTVDTWVDIAKKILSGDFDVMADFNKSVADFHATIDNIMEAPGSSLALLITILQSPADVYTSIRMKVEGYYLLTKSIIESVPETFQAAMVAVETFFISIIGLFKSTASGSIDNREEAVDIGNIIEEAFQNYQGWIERVEASSGYSPSYLTTASVADLYAKTKQKVLEDSYALKREVRIRLETSRTPLDMCWELYGDIEKLDQFISENSLSGDSIILIPAGYEVAYYV